MSKEPAPGKRAVARRNEETVLAAAGAAFVVSGVDVPVRDIAAKARVGVGTIYRHFPTRADLIVAVYRHQVEACAEAGPALLANGSTPHAYFLDRLLPVRAASSSGGGRPTAATCVGGAPLPPREFCTSPPPRPI